MLDPLPRRYTVCSRLFLPRCHRPSPMEKWVGFPQLSRLKRLRAGKSFEVADISLCSGLQVCLPPRSSLPLRKTPAGQPGLLRPSRTRFVASPRIGYANRPKTGNWRCGDLHPARLRPCRLLLSIVPPKILHGGFSLSTAPKLACQIGPSLIPLRLSLLPAFPLRSSSLPPPFVLSAAAWVLRSMSESTCSVEHHHASDLRRSTPRVLAPVRVMLSRAIIT